SRTAQPMPDAILGLSAYYHDSAACLVRHGRIVAAAQEERFSRIKHDDGFPLNAARYCLEEGAVGMQDLAAVVFYDKPYLKFERLLETYHAFAPRGLTSFLSAMPVWIKEKLFMRKMMNEELAKLGPGKPKTLFPEHHLSHAASAFYPSPFEEAAILTIDGVGEWATTTIGHGKGKDITLIDELHFPHSLGLLYSAFTYFLGFKVNSGEYKLMGLAPYGDPDSERTRGYLQKIRDELADVREDGSMLLNMAYFNYCTGLRMCVDCKWETLFDMPRRPAESAFEQQHMDLAMAIQMFTEEVVFKLAETARERTGCKNLCMAGGVSLNCVANGKLLRRGTFDDIWIQPAAGDAGGALGAALAAWHIHLGNDRAVSKNAEGKPVDAMRGAYLGPAFCQCTVEETAKKYAAPFKIFDDVDELCAVVAKLLDQGAVVGWHQGRMEYGPRALGGRTILGDPRNPEMQKKLNLKIKYREGFRPFAPSVMEEEIPSFFDLDRPSPYMLIVAPVRQERRTAEPQGYNDLEMYQRLYHLRSDVPAITHVDYSARIQSVNRDVNPRYWKLINSFRQLTGFGVVVNTSFNVRGEPIVCTPDDAYACFMRTEMDYLVVGDCLFEKANQPPWRETENWRDKYELD
ncbi:MAG: carbamoyltransferase, partial [Desulfovibrionaceae bacterium]